MSHYFLAISEILGTVARNHGTHGSCTGSCGWQTLVYHTRYCPLDIPKCLALHGMVSTQELQQQQQQHYHTPCICIEGGEPWQGRPQNLEPKWPCQQYVFFK